jgi:hypothetical protein
LRPREYKRVHTVFIGQPYRRWPSGQSYVATALRDPRVTRLQIVSAWVRATGLKLLMPQLDAFRARGGRSEMIVGIDLKGTSWQGLALAREKLDSVHVVHDPGGGTFHPKVYLASGPRIAYALIGSNNQTPGGLVFNYEAALGCVFDPSQAELADDIAAYVAQLRSDRAICRRLTATFLRRLRDRGLLDPAHPRGHPRPWARPPARAGSRFVCAERSGEAPSLATSGGSASARATAWDRGNDDHRAGHMVEADWGRRGAEALADRAHHGADPPRQRTGGLCTEHVLPGRLLRS